MQPESCPAVTLPSSPRKPSLEATRKGAAPPRYDYDEEVAVFFNDTAIIRNLPQGSWTLEVVDAMNRTKHQKVRLEVGREMKLTLNFH